ncbi:ISL3 family transposase [Alicyclobacillus acidoterrestris]|nr:ISL3 family transposase [Alicyclobacillus acidoterrestris]
MNLLNLPEFNIIEPPQENETDMLFKVEKNSPPSYCAECGFNTFYKHGSRKHLVMDLPIRAKRVGLLIHRKRYKCRNCNTTFWEPLIGIDEKRRMTRRLVEYIERESLKKEFVEVAETVGVTEKTVRNVFHDYVRTKEYEHVFYTPRWLGLDEIYIIKKARLIMTNIEEHTIFDIRENRNKETVINRLMQIPDRHIIEYVTMDMWNPYRDAVRECLPQAQIIVDKYHVVRMANNALETVRKSLRKHATAKERKALMHDRKILLKRNKDLDMQGQILLGAWLGMYPDLKEAYDLKEAFYEIWDARDIEEAEKMYVQWLKRLEASNVHKAYSDLTKAVRNWYAEILGYFHKRLTNAYTESFNNIVRYTDRSARGYSYDVLRAKLMFNEELHKARKPRFNADAFYYNVGTGIHIEESYGVGFSTLIAKLEEGYL